MTAENASGLSPHDAHPATSRSISSGVLQPCSTATGPTNSRAARTASDARLRVAAMSASYSHEADIATSSNPDARSNSRYRRPIRGSPAVQLLHHGQQLDEPHDLRRVGRNHHRASIVVPQTDDPARLQHTVHLRERPHRLPDVLEHRVGEHRVEGSVSERQVAHIRRLKSDVGDPSLRSGLLRDLDSRRVAVHADHLSGSE